MTSKFNQQLTPKTKSELAQEMEISIRTLQRRLKKVGLEVPRGLIPPSLQVKIFEVLNWYPTND